MKIQAKIDSYNKITCDFCGEKHPFKNLKQVPLKIDKNSRSQNMYAYQCDLCVLANKKITSDGQKIKSFIGKYKVKNETSIFDGDDDGE